MTLWPIPRPNDLRLLPVHIKPDWRGVTANVVGAFLWALDKCGSRWAHRVLTIYVQTIAGRIYRTSRPISWSLRGHEAVHDWQARTRGKVRYTLGYLLSRKYRQHAEAMAYGYEVACHGRDPEERAITAADPVYKMKWSRAEARTLIEAYAAEFRLGWTT